MDVRFFIIFYILYVENKLKTKTLGGKVKVSTFITNFTASSFGYNSTGQTCS